MELQIFLLHAASFINWVNFAFEFIFIQVRRLNFFFLIA